MGVDNIGNLEIGKKYDTICNGGSARQNSGRKKTTVRQEATQEDSNKDTYKASGKGKLQYVDTRVLFGSSDLFKNHNQNRQNLYSVDITPPV